MLEDNKTDINLADDITKMKGEELQNLIESLIQENISLKKSVVLKEIDIEKYKEILKNSLSTYMNLESGNLNETDKQYYNQIKGILLESDRKIFNINLKYNKEEERLENEYENLVKNLKNDNLIQNDNINDKLTEYRNYIKTLEDKLFNSEKYSQILQEKYEILIQENKLIKSKVQEEKEKITFVIDEIGRESKEQHDKIYKLFDERSNIISQNYITFIENEKNKINLIIENLSEDKYALENKIEILENENKRLKLELDNVCNENKQINQFIIENNVNNINVDNIRQEFEKLLKSNEEEIVSLTKENLDLKKSISSLEMKIKDLNDKNSLLENSMSDTINEINNNNKKLIQDLNEQILNLDQENKQIKLNYVINKNTEENLNNKINELLSDKQKLFTENNNLKFKMNELEIRNKTLSDQYNNVNNNYLKLHQQYVNMDEAYSNASSNLTENKKKYLDNEEEIYKLSQTINELRKENDSLMEGMNALKQNNIALTQNIETNNINYNIELNKLKNIILNYEKNK